MGEVKTLKVRHDDRASGTRFVRVTGRNRHGHVEFQFSIGDPDLFLEMTLPPDAFEEFCRDNQVRHLDEAQVEETRGTAVVAAGSPARFPP